MVQSKGQNKSPKTELKEMEIYFLLRENLK